MRPVIFVHRLSLGLHWVPRNSGGTMIPRAGHPPVTFEYVLQFWGALPLEHIGVDDLHAGIAGVDRSGESNHVGGFLQDHQRGDLRVAKNRIGRYADPQSRQEIRAQGGAE